MVRLLVVTGCGSRSQRLLFDALDQLEQRFGSLKLATPAKSPGPILEWATGHKALLLSHWSYANPYSTPDAVLTIGSSTPMTVALRYAWVCRIPAVRVHLDGTWVDVGASWARLLAKHPIRGEKAR